MRVVISPCCEKFYDEDDEVVTFNHWVSVDRADGSLAVSQGFEHLSGAMDFAHAVALGILATGEQAEVVNEES